MFDLNKMTKEEKEKRDFLYEEYGKIRGDAVKEYTEYITPIQLLYQKCCDNGWNNIIAIEAPYRKRCLDFDKYLDTKYHIKGEMRT